MVKPRPRRPRIGYDNQIFPLPGDLQYLQAQEYDMEQEQQLQDWRSPNETGYPKITNRQASLRRRPILPGFGNTASPISMHGDNPFRPAPYSNDLTRHPLPPAQMPPGWQPPLSQDEILRRLMTLKRQQGT